MFGFRKRIIQLSVSDSYAGGVYVNEWEYKLNGLQGNLEERLYLIRLTSTKTVYLIDIARLIKNIKTFLH